MIFKLYNVHAENASIEKWSIHSLKVNYIEHNRKLLPSNIVEIDLTEGSCLTGCRQIKGVDRSCREVDFVI